MKTLDWWRVSGYPPRPTRHPRLWLIELRHGRWRFLIQDARGDVSATGPVFKSITDAYDAVNAVEASVFGTGPVIDPPRAVVRDEAIALLGERADSYAADGAMMRKEGSLDDAVVYETVASELRLVAAALRTTAEAPLR